MKKLEEFSKILEFKKEDVANLTEKDMIELQGGMMAPDTGTGCDCDTITWTYSGCC